MTNSQIADVFDEIAEILDFLGENPFRVRAYRNSSRAIRDHAAPMAGLVQEDGEKQLIEIKGIGKDLAAKIVTLVRTGELPMLKDLQAKVPSSVPRNQVTPVCPSTKTISSSTFESLCVRDR